MIKAAHRAVLAEQMCLVTAVVLVVLQALLQFLAVVVAVARQQYY